MTDAPLIPTPDAAATPPHTSLSRAVAWLGMPSTALIALSLTAVAMLIWTWGAWCDPIKDFGREIYVAWRLAAGEVLYRDIDYFNGPVSPYLNSLVFRLLGTSLLSLEMANLLWWSALTLMSYRLYLILAGRLAAFVAVFLFITLFSFLQLNEIANFNFVNPYAHEMTHSLVCAFAMLTCLHAYLRKANPRALWACGFLIGVMFLMKVEVTVSAAAALATGVGLHLRAKRAKAEWLKAGGVLAAAAIVPAMIAFALLKMEMPAGQALRGLLGSWKYLRDARITNGLFYRWVSGTDDPLRHTITMLRMLLVEGAVLTMAAAAALVVRHDAGTEAKAVAAVSAAVIVATATFIFWDQIDWQAAARPLNVISILTVIGWALVALRTPREKINPRLILRLSFSVFALTLLAKIFFKVAIFHYGFALTAPAFSLFAMLMVSWIPAQVERAGGTPWVFRAVALTMLGSFAVKHFVVYHTVFHPVRTQTLGNGPDEFSVYRRTTVIRQMLDLISTRVAPQDTLAALPEGAMLNYLVRRVNPTGEITLLPGEFLMFGSDRVLDRFQTHPPDWIVTMRTDTTLFGFKGFGRDYGEELFHWIRSNYRDVTPPGAIDPDFPMYLLKRDPAFAATRPAFRPTTSRGG